MKVTQESFFVPIIFFFLDSLVSLLVYFFSDKFIKGYKKNILSFTSGTGNLAVFGLTIVSSIMGDNYISIVFLAVLGALLFENTLGFFIIARGNFSIKKSIIKLLKLPTLYSFAFGLLAALLHMKFGNNLSSVFQISKILSAILTTFLLGLCLSDLRNIRIDHKFNVIAIIARFIIWPIIIFFVIFLDNTYFHILSSEVYKVMMLLSVVPLATTTVIYATELDAEPEKAALSVMLSILLALFAAPLISLLI